MQRLLFTVKTTLFGATDFVRLIVRFNDSWHHLALNHDADGWKTQCSLADEVRSLPVVVRARGPAFGRVRLLATLPDLSVNTAVDFSVPADRAFDWIREDGEFRW